MDVSLRLGIEVMIGVSHIPSKMLTHSVGVSLDLHEGRVLQHSEFTGGDGPVLPHGHGSGVRGEGGGQLLITCRENMLV